MNKVFIIFKREYITRVKNKTFVIMTILGPVLMASFYALIIWVATRDAQDTEQRKVIVKDNSGFFQGKLDSINNYRFEMMNGDRKALLSKVTSNEYDALLQIDDKDLNRIDSVNWISMNTLSIVQSSKLESYLAEKVYESKLAAMNIKQGTIDSLMPKVDMGMIETDSHGELKNSSSGLKSAIGFAMALLIYLFIFIYGAMVMRSTLEEKMNRIVEVIVSSVRPFQMMMGKILGVAAVGLTQFLAWVVLSGILIAALGTAYAGKMGSAVGKGVTQNPAAEQAMSGAKMEMLDSLQSMPYGTIIAIFLMFFIGGYLLYGSMFAAIGSAVSQESDVQQFMLPVTLPLVFGFVIAQSVVIQDPHGSLAVLFSMIPLTSPIVMAVRAPFGVPMEQVLLSFGILAATFVFFVWLSGRIYRVGILMYGKKPSWRQLGKWVFMKD